MGKTKKEKFFNSEDLIHIKPLTDKQNEAFHTFHNFPVCAFTGPPGTGKSQIGAYLGLRDVINNHYEQMILLRSAAPTREIGFLPGSQEEKTDPYFEYAEHLFSNILRYKSNNTKNLVESGLLHLETTSFLRGKTFDRSVILLDEVQNTTFSELHTTITRMGQDSKLILVGDSNQCDLSKKNDQSGMAQIMDILNDTGKVGHVDFGFEDIIRSDFVKDYIKVGMMKGYF